MTSVVQQMSVSATSKADYKLVAADNQSQEVQQQGGSSAGTGSYVRELEGD